MLETMKVDIFSYLILIIRVKAENKIQKIVNFLFFASLANFCSLFICPLELTVEELE